MIVGDITTYLESLYPLSTGLDQDNIGLQVGNNDSPIDRVFIALTLTDAALEQALSAKAGLTITHHPLFYRPLSCIDLATPLGCRVQKLMDSKICVYSAHTNLDVGWGGVSDALADIYGIRDRQVVQRTSEDKFVKLVVYVPEKEFDTFRDQFLEAAVGHIGKYSHCSFSVYGEGTYMPLEGATPYSGKQDVLSKVREKRFETILSEKDIPAVVKRLKAIHPYEEVAYDLIPLLNPGRILGLGRYGVIEPIRKGDFQMPILGVYRGNLDDNKVFAKVGVCGGSGGKMVADAVRLGLDLFISAEFSFHDELLAADHGLTLLDLGHDASERPVLQNLKKMLLAQFPSLDVVVEAGWPAKA